MWCNEDGYTASTYLPITVQVDAVDVISQHLPASRLKAPRPHILNNCYLSLYDRPPGPSVIPVPAKPLTGTWKCRTAKYSSKKKILLTLVIIIVGSNRMMWWSSKVLMLECNFLYSGMRFFAPAISVQGNYSARKSLHTALFIPHLVLAGQGVGICLPPKVHSATHSQAHTRCQHSALPLSPRKMQNDLEPAAHCHINSAFRVQKGWHRSHEVMCALVFLHGLPNCISEVVHEEAFLVAFTPVWITVAHDQTNIASVSGTQNIPSSWVCFVWSEGWNGLWKWEGLDGAVAVQSCVIRSPFT